MTLRSILVTPLFLLAAAALHGVDGNSLPSATTVMGTVLEHDAQRRASLDGYRGMRRYVLENERMGKHAEMLAQVDSDLDGTKHFQVLQEEGWKAAYKHVFRKMLESEAEASRPEVSITTCLCSDNYEFRMVGSQRIDGRLTYTIDITPKRHDERLFAGRIWVDAQDYAVVRAEGKPSKMPSFWIHSVHFVHIYQKAGPFWFPSATESTSQVRVFGATKVTISYFNYSPKSQQAPETAKATLHDTASR